MMKLFAKCFEAICNIVAVLNTLLLTGFSILGGYLFAEEVIYSDSVPYMILFGVCGLVISFIVNTFTFGFVAQVIQIRKELEKLNNK